MMMHIRQEALQITAGISGSSLKRPRSASVPPGVPRQEKLSVGPEKMTAPFYVFSARRPRIEFGIKRFGRCEDLRVEDCHQVRLVTVGHDRLHRLPGCAPGAPGAPGVCSWGRATILLGSGHAIHLIQKDKSSRDVGFESLKGHFLPPKWHCKETAPPGVGTLASIW